MSHDTFQQRVAIRRILARVAGESMAGLDILRGLGIKHRGVKLLATVSVIARYAEQWLHVGDTTLIRSTALKRLLHCAFDLQPGWNSVGPLWVFCESDNNRAPVDGHTKVLGIEDDLWAVIEAEFASRFPCTALTENREGFLRVDADRASNVRPLTSAEHVLAARVSKYVRAGESVSVLLYGPQGSAKTTAACSIAHECTGGYFRLSAEHVSREMTYALVRLAPKAVIVDDIDRVLDVSLLDMLDALTGAGVVTLCTSNTAPDGRHGDDSLMDAALVRSGRLDIHHRVDRLDSESWEEIRCAVGLASVDLGPHGVELLASDLACLGRRHRAGDLADPQQAVEDLLTRRSNTQYTLRAVPTPSVTETRKLTTTSKSRP